MVAEGQNELGQMTVCRRPGKKIFPPREKENRVSNIRVNPGGMKWPLQPSVPVQEFSRKRKGGAVIPRPCRTPTN